MILPRVYANRSLRHLVLEPYKQAFEPTSPTDADTEDEMPPHRYLFYCYVFQYHVMRFGQISLQIVSRHVSFQSVITDFENV